MTGTGQLVEYMDERRSHGPDFHLSFMLTRVNICRFDGRKFDACGRFADLEIRHYTFTLVAVTDEQTIGERTKGGERVRVDGLSARDSGEQPSFNLLSV